MIEPCAIDLVSKAMARSDLENEKEVGAVQTARHASEPPFITDADESVTSR